jgi:hypothetical protein
MKIRKKTIQFEGEKRPRRFIEEDVITFIILVTFVTGLIIIATLQ